MQKTTLVSLVRHGTVHNPLQIFYGRLPGFGLNAEGYALARCAARSMGNKHIAALFTSPLLRARQTAREFLLCYPRLALQTSCLLTEVLSAYEGRPAEEVAARYDDIYTGTAPGFEQPIDVFRRTEKFIMRVRTRYAGRHVVAVTHGDCITFMILWARGALLTPANKIRLTAAGISDTYPAPASITTFTYRTGSSAERPEVDYVKP